MKTYLLHKATIVTAAKEAAGSVIVSGGKIADILYCEDDGFDYKIEMAAERYPDMETIVLEGKHLMAGGIEAHVHFREPGFLQKENIATGSAAAAHGGYTTVCTMPNLNPTPDTLEHLEVQLKAIRETA